uniref:stonustoxin subunit alpha-like n=1 Tax=Centroberyx gerrardi TaxID=166262 RepID=UPI003AACA6C7
MASDSLLVAALGRPFTSGMLYDSRQDGPIPVVPRKSDIAYMSELTMRCNDSLEDKVVKHFPQIHDKLSNFKNMCNDYTFTLRQTMAKKLPSIRGCEEDESALEKVFEDKDRSPFSNKNLSEWMDSKEKEMNVLRSCVDMMEGTKAKIVKNRTELDREVLAPQVKNAICFVFTSLESAEPYLRVLADYLDSPKSGSTQDVKTPTQDQWCSCEVSANMREKAKVFSDFARAMKENDNFCFLVAAIENEKYKGASIYHYREGSLVTDDFSRPEIPAVETLKYKTDLLWYAFDLNMDSNTVERLLELSDGNKMAIFQGKHPYPDHPERFDYYQQVLCREGLTGRCYWEVEWIGFVSLAVAYKGTDRKGASGACLLGGNDKSWSLKYSNDGEGDIFSAFHDGKETPVTGSSAGIKRIGVYLDWPAGTLSYYRVSSNTLTHLHTFRTKFTEPLYPGFYVELPCCYVSLCQVE